MSSTRTSKLTNVTRYVRTTASRGRPRRAASAPNTSTTADSRAAGYPGQPDDDRPPALPDRDRQHAAGQPDRLRRQSSTPESSQHTVVAGMELMRETPVPAARQRHGRQQSVRADRRQPAGPALRSRSTRRSAARSTAGIRRTIPNRRTSRSTRPTRSSSTSTSNCSARCARTASRRLGTTPAMRTPATAISSATDEHVQLARRRRVPSDAELQPLCRPTASRTIRPRNSARFGRRQQRRQRVQLAPEQNTVDRSRREGRSAAEQAERDRRGVPDREDQPAHPQRSVAADRPAGPGARRSRPGRGVEARRRRQAHRQVADLRRLQLPRHRRSRRRRNLAELGRQLPNTPPHSFSLWTTYAGDPGVDWSAAARSTRTIPSSTPPTRPTCRTTGGST